MCPTSLAEAGEVATPPPNRRAATRDKLLDAARTLLIAEGLQGVSVERLCEEAGFTRGAFYSNFSSKDELALALVRRELDATLESLREAARESTVAGLSPEEATAAVIDRFWVLHPPDRDWYLLHREVELRGVRGDTGAEDFKKWWESACEGIAEILRDVLGHMNLQLRIEERDACVLLIGMWDALVLESVLKGREVDLGMVRTALPTMLASLTEPRGALSPGERGGST